MLPAALALVAVVASSSTPLFAVDDWWRERAEADEREASGRERRAVRDAHEPKLGVAIGTMIGSVSGVVVGGAMATALFLAAFSTSSFVLLLGSYAAIPVLVVAGASLGGWIGGDDGADAFAGAVGGLVGLFSGAVAAGIGFYSAAALPIPDNARFPTGIGLGIGGLALGVAASGGAAYVTPWVRGEIDELLTGS
jgi:hypothetical protein